MSTASPSRVLVTQTAPSPTAIARGEPSTTIVLATVFVSESICDTVSSSKFATHTQRSPAATAVGTRADGDRRGGLVRLRVDLCERVDLERRRRGGLASDEQEREHGDADEEQAGKAEEQRRPPANERPKSGFARQAELGPRVLDELAAAPVSLLRRLRQGFDENGVEADRQVGIEHARGRWILGDMAPEDRQRALPAERRLTRQTLEQDTAERVDVGAEVERPSPDLLRGDVVGCPGEMAGLGRSSVGGDVLRETEVAQVAVLAASLRRHEDVARLHIPVHQTPLVRRIQGIGDLLDDRQRAVGREQALLLQHAPEIDPLDVAHRDEQAPVVLARLVDRDDSRVVDRRGQARLAQEALAEARVLRELGCQQLQRHLAAEDEILGQVDDTHAAPPEQRLDPVTGDLAAPAEVRLERPLHRARVRRPGRRRKSAYRRSACSMAGVGL